MQHRGSLDAFVGRADELARIGALFVDAGERLVTITGPGGIGKTRLARELATRHLDRFEGGAWWCDLTEANDVQALCSTVAHALGIPTARGQVDRETIAHALVARGSVLLVFDNFERLARDGGPVIARWLEAPNVRAIVTSRERLRLEGEIVFELGPLSLPTSDDIAKSEAGQLMLDRAKRRRATWSPSPADAPQLVRLLTELDGIPLAIELAAARLPLLGPRALIERLDERFRVLGAPRARDEGDRALTLHATIDWSWQLLDGAERRALAQLAVFRGGFDVEAAEAIVVEPERPVLDLVESLYDKSLVRAEPGEPGRFGLYLSIRDFAATRLTGEEEAATRARHASYYAQWAERWPSAVHGADAVSARARLLRDRENLAAVVEAAPDPSLALRAALALEPVMSVGGPFDQYAALLDRALSREGDERLRIEATIVRGNVHRQAGRPDAARHDLEQALACARAIDARPLVARALGGLATVDLVQGQLDDARARYEEALALHRESGDRVHEATTLSAFGAVLAGSGNLEGARELEERALSLHREVGNLREVGMTSAFLGNIAIDAARFDEARLFFADAAAIHDQIGDRFGQAFTAANLAILDHRQRAFERALSGYDEALRGFAQLGARRYLGAFTGYRATLRLEQGAAAEAVRELERACTILEEASDERFEALFRAHFAVARLVAGEGIERAQRDVREARTQIDRVGDPFLSLAVRLLAAPVERASGADHAQIAALLASAEHGPPNTPAPVDQSADVFFALRIARAALGEGRPLERRDQWPKGTLVVHPEGHWMRPPAGAPVELAGRESLRRLLTALCKARLEKPNHAVAREALVAAGWPGERILRKAAQNRLRVAIATLRKLGLSDAIVTDADGYRLREDLALVLWAEAPD